MLTACAEPQEKPIIALTFDDGPNTTITPQVLDILEMYEAKATFFLEGRFIDETTAPVIRRMDAMGCEVCNHAKTHPYMNTLTSDEIIEQVSYTDSCVTAIIGKKPKFFRPPYIAVNQLMHAVIHHTFIAGIGCDDWLPEVTANMRVDRVLENACDGQIVLLHDGDWNAPTPEVVSRVVPALIERGFELVTVSELFDRKGVKPVPHHPIVYSMVPQEEEAPVAE